ILVSKDKGATWAPLAGSVNAWFGPIFKDEEHFVGFGKEGFLETKDGGETWKAAAPPPGEKGMTDKWFSNVAWDPQADIFYISRMGKPAFKYERSASTKQTVCFVEADSCNGRSSGDHTIPDDFRHDCP